MSSWVPWKLEIRPSLLNSGDKKRRIKIMFGLFKKKVKIKDYCRKKYDFIFSANGRKIMDDLVKQCNVSLGEEQKDKYRDHFIAAFFQLAGVAFS